QFRRPCRPKAWPREEPLSGSAREPIAMAGSMNGTATEAGRSCWCAESRLRPYSPEYLACSACGTLVSRLGLSSEQVKVRDDASDFYGKEYWLSHQAEDLGLPTIHERARQDLPERCLYWLRLLLTYRLPPARVLEVGCAHGAFVALLRWAGFDATGLEVSPWVVEFARGRFGLPMLQGPIAEQGLPAGSLDVVVLNDVLEHLPDPVGTVRACAGLLRPDGLLVIQTPAFPEEAEFAQLQQRNDCFLSMMTGSVSEQHIYLFS